MVRSGRWEVGVEVEGWEWVGGVGVLLCKALCMKSAIKIKLD